MLDEPENWEKMFTVDEVHFQQAEGKLKALFLPYPELSRRVESRLRVVISHTLQKQPQSQPRWASDDEREYFSVPGEVPGEMEIVNALLQRAIVMHRLTSLGSQPSVISDILRREITNARRDMLVARLPIQSPAT